MGMTKTIATVTLLLGAVTTILLSYICSTMVNNPLPVKTTETKETRHLAFLKVHKTGSSTIQNIIIRFGLSRKLTFMLSGDSHYLSKSKFTFNRLMPMPGSRNGSGKYDILCNHAVFNYDKFKSFMHTDAKFVAIVREPLDLFISAAYYYRHVITTEYLLTMNSESFIKNILHYPDKYEPTDLTQSRTFNYMSRDFGLVLESVDQARNISEQHFKAFLDEIANAFDLVLVMERFDESLVLFKRYFGWSMKDIVYVKNNVYNDNALNMSALNSTSPEQFSKVAKDNLTEADLKAFENSHWMDIKLYQFFSKRIEEQIRNETSFTSEVQCFKNYLNDVQQFCSKADESNVTDYIVLQKSQWSASFIVTTDECNLILMDEVELYYLLIERRKHMLYA